MVLCAMCILYGYMVAPKYGYMVAPKRDHFLIAHISKLPGLICLTL